MADTKITALAAIATVDPAADVLPIVDISDTSMAASGTTKKVTSNQILGAGGTATLASATITGDLTVDTNVLKVDTTNNRVGIGTATPGVRCDILSDNNTSLAAVLRVNSNNAAVNTALAYDGLIGSSTLTIQSGTSAAMIFNTNNVNERYRIASDGVATWSNVGGVAGTAMTLNATGLGVGVTPSQKLTVLTNLGISASTATAADDRLVFSENMGSVNLGSQIVWQNSSFSTPYASIGVSNGAAGSNGTLIFSTCSSIFTNTNTERVRIKPTGQVRFFPLAADPAGAETGDLYYNSVSNKLKCYNGTTWNDLF